jgi:hypothetical protein
MIECFHKKYLIMENKDSMRFTFSTRNILTVFTFAALVCQSIAQAGPPVGGGGGGGVLTDSNPYNPANWEQLPVTGTHISVNTSWYPDSNGNPYKDEITTNLLAPHTGAINAFGASNGSYHPRSAKSVETANVTVKWQWKGVGAAPAKIWILKVANAGASANPAGSASASNGLGSPEVPMLENPGVSVNCNGTKLKEATVSGGKIEETFNLTATATGGCSDAPYGNSAHTSCGYSIQLKGVKTGTTLGQTYIKGTNGIKTPAPDGEYHTIFSSYYEAGHYNYSCWQESGRVLYGNWLDPFHTWNANGHTYTDDFFHEYSTITENYSVTSVESLVNGTPKEFPVTLDLSDTGANQDQTVITTNHKIFVHAPITKPVLDHKHTFSNGLKKYWEEVHDPVVDWPGFAAPNTSVRVDFNQPAIEWNVFGTIAAGGSIAAMSPVPPYVKAIIQAVAFTIAQFSPKADHLSVNFCWGADKCTYNGSTTKPVFDVNANWKMHPVVEQAHEIQYLKADAFDEHGFTSVVDSIANVPIEDDYYPYGKFWNNQSGNSGGNNGGGTNG